MNTATDVNIFEYLDYRSFLQDYYAEQKAKNPSFSYATWSETAGISSRSFLRLIVVGKRPLTPKTLPIVTNSLKIGVREKKFFIKLVNFTLAADLDQREAYLRELNRYKNDKMARIFDSYNYLSSHWCPKIHVLLTLDDIDKSAESLAQMTKLSVSKLKQLLGILNKAGIASVTDDGQWYAKDTNFIIPDELNNLAIQSFHQNSLEMAKQAIAYDPSSRQFQSIFMALSQDEYKELCSKIDELTTGLLKQFASSKGRNRKLYQLNTNLIPVTSRLIHHCDEPKATDDRQKGVMK